MLGKIAEAAVGLFLIFSALVSMLLIGSVG